VSGTRRPYVARSVFTQLPAPYGDPSALDSLATSAAPLLAGFAFVLIGLILDDRFKLAAKNLALLLLVLAILLLITTVEFAFTARRYYIPPDELIALIALDERSRKLPDHVEAVSQTYLDMLPRHRAAAMYARLAYDGGIIFLLLGVIATLIPPSGLNSGLRISAVAVIGFTALAQLLSAATPDEVRWMRTVDVTVNSQRVKQRNPMRVGLYTLMTGLTYGFVWTYRANREVGDTGLAKRRCRQDDTMTAAAIVLFYYWCALVIVECIVGNWQPSWFEWTVIGVSAGGAYVLLAVSTSRRLLGEYYRRRRHRRKDVRMPKILDFVLFVVPPFWYCDLQLKLNRTWDMIRVEEELRGAKGQQAVLAQAR
jgi:hypothetical protein